MVSVNDLFVGKGPNFNWRLLNCTEKLSVTSHVTYCLIRSWLIDGLSVQYSLHGLWRCHCRLSCFLQVNSIDTDDMPAAEQINLKTMPTSSLSHFQLPEWITHSASVSFPVLGFQSSPELFTLILHILHRWVPGWLADMISGSEIISSVREPVGELWGDSRVWAVAAVGIRGGGWELLPSRLHTTRHSSGFQPTEHQEPPGTRALSRGGGEQYISSSHTCSYSAVDIKNEIGRDCLKTAKVSGWPRILGIHPLGTINTHREETWM